MKGRVGKAHDDDVLLLALRLEVGGLGDLSAGRAGLCGGESGGVGHQRGVSKCARRVWLKPGGTARALLQGLRVGDGAHQVCYRAHGLSKGDGQATAVG